MGLAVVTVASGGLPVVESTAGGTPVTETANGYGVPVTKVVGKPGMPVVFETIGVGGGAPVFPAVVTGVIGSWDASVTASLTLSGAEVLSIADQSGGGRTMSWTAFAKPTYSATGFNSKPAIQIVSGSGLTTASGFPMGTGNTLTGWYVGTMCNPTGGETDARVMNYIAAGATVDYDNNGSWAVYRGGFANDLLIFLRNGGAANTGNSIAVYPAPHRFIWTINSSGGMTLYVDGISKGTGTKVGNWVSGGAVHIGFHRLSAGDYKMWTGPIAECGITTGYSDATAVAALDTYLKSKWGL